MAMAAGVMEKEKEEEEEEEEGQVGNMTFSPQVGGRRGEQQVVAVEVFLVRAPAIERTDGKNCQTAGSFWCKIRQLVRNEKSTKIMK